MLAYWSSHKTAPLQKLNYHATWLTKQQAAELQGKQPAVYTSTRHKSNNLQSNRCQGTIINTRSSRDTWPRQPYIVNLIEAATLSDAYVASLANSTPRVINTESFHSLENIPYCRPCLAKSHRASKCSLLPLQLRARLIQNHNANLKTLSRHKLSLYRPKYGRSSPSCPKNRFSTPTKKQ